MGGFAGEVELISDLLSLYLKMKNLIFILPFILTLPSCKKEKLYNPDLNITNAHWYKLKTHSADTLFSVYIPNAFTPNGDGVNDSFKPKGDNYLLNNFRVYSKTNQILFETNDIGDGWNGKTKSNALEKVQTGTYTYQLKVDDIYGKVYEYSGNVMLFN